MEALLGWEMPGRAGHDEIGRGSREEKCHRMLNAIEPGAEIPIHRRPTKDESFVGHEVEGVLEVPKK